MGRNRKRFSTKKKSVLKKKVDKEIKKFVHPEMKYFDTGNSTVYSNSGAVIQLSDIAQGLTNSTRIGDSVTIKHLTFKWYVQGNSQNPCNAARLILFVDKYNQGTDPTPGDVLQTVGSVQAIVSAANINHLPRYRIIYDKLVNLEQQATYANPSVATIMPVGCKVGHFYKKMNLTIHYTGNSSTNIYGNQLYALLLGDVSMNDVTMTWWVRLAYTDA